MLRLDVERLKGEVSVARLTRAAVVVSHATDRAVPVRFAGREMPTPYQAEAALVAATARMPKDAGCGGPGRCGRIGCGHPGW